MLNVKQESLNTNFFVFGLTQPGIEPESIILFENVTNAPFTPKNEAD